MCRRRTSSGFIELRGLWVYKDSGEGAAVGAGKKGGGRNRMGKEDHWKHSKYFLSAYSFTPLSRH